MVQNNAISCNPTQSSGCTKMQLQAAGCMPAINKLAACVYTDFLRPSIFVLYAQEIIACRAPSQTVPPSEPSPDYQPYSPAPAHQVAAPATPHARSPGREMPASCWYRWLSCGPPPASSCHLSKKVGENVSLITQNPTKYHQLTWLRQALQRVHRVLDARLRLDEYHHRGAIAVNRLKNLSSGLHLLDGTLHGRLEDRRCPKVVLARRHQRAPAVASWGAKSGVRFKQRILVHPVQTHGGSGGGGGGVGVGAGG